MSTNLTLSPDSNCGGIEGGIKTSKFQGTSLHLSYTFHTHYCKLEVSMGVNYCGTLYFL